MKLLHKPGTADADPSQTSQSGSKFFVGYHFLGNDNGRTPEASITTDPDALARAICESTADHDARNRLIQEVVADGNESVLVQLLKHPIEKIRQFASCALWNIWLHEEGEEAYQELNMGINALRQRHYDEALQLFQNVLTHFPDWAEALNKVATTLYLMGCPRDSMAFCREVLKRKPHHFGAWHGLILCAIQLEDWPNAREGLKHFRQLNPHAGETSEFEKILQEKS